MGKHQEKGTDNRNMPCPSNQVLMNFQLGRFVNQKERQHIAICHKCRKNAHDLEKVLEIETLEMQDQSGQFSLKRAIKSKAHTFSVRAAV